MVKYFIDHYRVKFFLTDSSSFYLKNLFSESLAGRKFVFELFPFSFREFLQLKLQSIKVPPLKEPISSAIHERLDNLFWEYVEFGGFPEVIAAGGKKEKGKILEDIVSSYIQLEVQRLSDFKKVDTVRDLILLLAERTGQLLEIRKISSDLGVAWETVSNYLAFLEGTYFISP